MNLFDHTVVAAATFALATVFAMAGLGSAVALVPALALLGLPLNMAKALGLFANTLSTLTGSVMNARRGMIEVRWALPLVAGVLVATPLGALSSQALPERAVQWALVGFMLLSAVLLVTRREAQVAYARPWLMPVLGALVGFVSGLLGVGGGGPLLAALVLMGYDAKRTAYAVSFVIPFSTAGGFATYLGFVEMDWALLATIGVAAAAGGFVGNRILHFRLSGAQVKKLIAALLLVLAGKVALDLI